MVNNLGKYLLIIILALSCQADNTTTCKVFKYNQINSITSLDPAFSKSQSNIWVVNHIFNGLVQLDDSLNIIPAIAKSWEVKHDTLYSFKLRDDVYFHDDPCFDEGKGRRVVASDFVFSLNRLLDEKVNSPGSWLFKDRVSTNAFKAIDDSTLTIRLTNAFIPFLSILTMQYCSVVPYEAVGYYGDGFSFNPVGTGPFRFKRWEENEALYLITNDNYFEKTTHNLDGVKTSFIPDRKVAYLEIENGNLDFISGLESTFITDWLDENGNLNDKQSLKLNFHKSPYLNTEYLGINLQSKKNNEWLKKKKFRQALNFAINKKEMLLTLRSGIGYPAHSGFTAKGLPSFDEKLTGYPYDLNRAMGLLKEIDFVSNEKKPLLLYTNQDYLDICIFVAKEWEKLGVKTEIELLESSLLRSKMKNGDISLFRASWIADYPEAESFLCVFYSGNPAPPNYTRFRNDKYDELYDLAVSEENDSIRYSIYHEMEKILIEEAPVIFLFYDQSALFTSKRITGVSKNGINLLQVKSLQMTE